MAKNNKKGAVIKGIVEDTTVVESVMNALEIENTEVVEMAKEYCTECGKELLGKVIVRGAGVCMECVNEMMEEVKLYEENSMEVVEIDSVVRCEEDMRLDAEFNKEYELLLVKETKLNAYIKNAIKHGKNNKVKGAMACITKGQLIAIARNYEVIVGRRMSEAQYNHLKTLDGSQAHFVEMAIRQVQGKIRQHDFDKRIAESRAKKALANA